MLPPARAGVNEQARNNQAITKQVVWPGPRKRPQSRWMAGDGVGRVYWMCRIAKCRGRIVYDDVPG
jgi:hypothetical protein